MLCQLKCDILYFLRLIVVGFITISCSDPFSSDFPGLIDNDTIFSGNILYSETFEGSEPFIDAHSMDIGDWDYALKLVSYPIFKGLKSVRFEIKEDQPLVSDGKRSEVVIVKGSEGEISKNAWYSFAVYFPSIGYEYDDKREAINQWYQNGSPATSIRTEEDRIYLATGNELDTKKEIDIWAFLTFYSLDMQKT